MTSSTDKIVESFPYPTISPIIGQPGYDTIAEVHLQLNANAASVQSHLGDGALGLLYLTVTPAVYNTLSLVEFIPPPNPGADPTIPQGSTGPQIADIRLQFTNATKLYRQYDTTDKALKQLLLGAVDDMFVRSLRNRHIGYANVTTLALLTHLYTVYAKINTADLEANTARMKVPYDVNLPIETFFDQIEDAIEYASAGNAPFTPVQVVNTAYNVIFTTGMFNDDCKLWKRKPLNEKTWTQFKIDFALAHEELVESTQTAQAAGYQANSAETIRQTAAAIENLANATLADRESMAALTLTVSTQTTALAEANTKLVTALAKITMLERELTMARATNPRAPTNAAVSYTHYCWTHGPTCSHPSCECNRKAEGHKDEATATNKMGGRTEKWRYRPGR